MQGVEQSLAGVASALLNTAQQIGAALGLALLTAVARVASDRELAGAADVLPRAIADGDARLVELAGQALTTGYATALGVEAVLLAVAAALAALTRPGASHAATAAPDTSSSR